MTSGAARRRRARPAFWVFVAAEAAALPVLLWFGRDRSFYVDEWTFLSTRTAGDVDDLLDAHWDHWTTLPVVVYRLLWVGFGARTYLPYQLVLVLLHLGVAAALRAVMRRAGVDPWIATAAAVLFVAFGAGWQNIVWAFQMTFVGALLFGFLQLLCADHDGPIAPRDGLGLAAGLVALTFSGVAVTTTAVVGVAVLVRRGWRAALFHVVPLAAVYGLWWLRYAGDVGDRPHRLGDVFGFTRTGLRATFEGAGQHAVVAAVLGALLVGGSVLVVRAGGARAVRGRLAAPAAMLAGGIGFWMVTGYARATPDALEGAAFGVERAGESRYVHIGFALVLPALAVAADAVARRWRYALPAVVGLLLVGVPGNLRDLDHGARSQEQLIRSVEGALYSVPELPLASQLPPSFNPSPFGAPGVTVRWLLAADADGKLPDAEISATRAATLQLGWSLGPARATGAPTACRTIDAPARETLAAGDRLVLRRGVVEVRYVPRPGVVSAPLTLPGAPRDRHPYTYVARAGPLPLLVAPVGEVRTAELCR